MNQYSMKKISRWGKIIGILMMISGGLSAITGLFAMLIGAVPGLIVAYIGYLLFKTGKDADEFLQTNSEESISKLLDNYARYLFLQGILLIVGLAFMFMLFVLGGFGMLAFFNLFS